MNGDINIFRCTEKVVDVIKWQEAIPHEKVYKQ